MLTVRTPAQYHWPPSGSYPLEVAGCRFYRGEIESGIGAENAGTGALVFTTARLASDPANQHDQHAVAVHIGDRLVGHVPRERASEVRRQLDRVPGSTATCLAVVSGGVVTSERKYDYVIELDIAESSDCVRGHLDARQSAFGGACLVAGGDPGTYMAMAWLPRGALSDFHRSILPWTTDQWDTVNYYLSNSRRAGLGHRLLAITKSKHAELFGPGFAEASIVCISGRVAILALREGRR